MKQFFKSFFYSKNKPSPIYFWSSLFLFITFIYMITEVIKCILNISTFSNIMLGQLVGLILSLIGLYNIDKHLNNKKEGSKEVMEDPSK